jgi:hypothetical protein
MSFAVPGSYTLTFSSGSINSAPSNVVVVSFFEVGDARDVTEVTVANPYDRGAGQSRVSIFNATSVNDGNLSGTPPSPANTQDMASSRHPTTGREQDQLRFGAIRRGTVVSNPFGANP